MHSISEMIKMLFIYLSTFYEPIQQL